LVRPLVVNIANTMRTLLHHKNKYRD